MLYLLLLILLLSMTCREVLDLEQNIELQQVVYNILKMQLQFGIYQPGERLPTMEETSRLFQVSIRTIRAAYRNLQKEGFITVSPKVGIKVNAQYSTKDSSRYVNSFFSSRHDALLDLSCSMQPLFSKAQWLGFQNASPDLLDCMEQFAKQKGIQPSNKIIRQYQQIYGSLQNRMFMRLVWQVLMFYQAPVMGLMDFQKITNQNPLLQMIDLCRRQKWEELRSAIETFQGQMASGLSRFYDTQISLSSSEQQIDFQWSGYKKASQICYSLAMDLLTGMQRGIYPAGEFLPSAEKLAKEKGVSVSTVRRTLSILNSIGAVKSINGIGTQILSLEQIAENCDFTQPLVRTRLLDFVQSLHILTISCKDVARITMTSIGPADAVQLKERLRLMRRLRQYDISGYGILEMFCRLAPYRAIRTIYTELFQQLLWGYPLRITHAEQSVMESYYLPCLDTFMEYLEKSDTNGLADKLEIFMTEELNRAIKLLDDLGIHEAAVLSIKK